MDRTRLTMTETRNALRSIRSCLNLRREIEQEWVLEGLGFKADGHSLLEKGVHLFIEIERKQKHPDTNVAKYYQWLVDVEPKHRAILLHWYLKTPYAKKGARENLGRWLAERMKRSLGQRFHYYRFADDGLSESTAKALREQVLLFRRRRDW